MRTLCVMLQPLQRNILLCIFRCCCYCCCNLHAASFTVISKRLEKLEGNLNVCWESKRRNEDDAMRWE